MNQESIGWGMTRMHYKRLFWKLYYKDYGADRPILKRFVLIWNPAKKYEGHTYDRMTLLDPPNHN